MAIKKGMITGTACVIIPQHLQRLAEYIKYCLYISSIIVYTVNIHIASRDDIYNKFVIKVESVMCYKNLHVRQHRAMLEVGTF
jgi:predicted nuclease with TOPRIM domain